MKTGSMKAIGFASLLLGAFAAAWSPLSACLHMAEKYEASFEAQSQQSIVYHDGRDETLIVKVEAPKSRPAALSDGGHHHRPGLRRGRRILPMNPPSEEPESPSASLVAIVPIPAKPDSVLLDVLKLARRGAGDEAHAAAADKLFEELKDLVDLHSQPRRRGMRGGLSFGVDSAGGFQEVIAGPFGITRFPNSAAGVKAMNAWLTARSLETAGGAQQSEPVKALDTSLPSFQHYLKGTWTFCAIRVVDMSKALIPLKIRFPSKKLFFPIKLTAAGTASALDRQGSYTVYCITAAGKSMDKLVEDMAMHKLDKASGLLSGPDFKQNPLPLSAENVDGSPAIQGLLEDLNLKPGGAQVMRFSGAFVGREAVRFDRDVLAD